MALHIFIRHVSSNSLPDLSGANTDSVTERTIWLWTGFPDYHVLHCNSNNWSWLESAHICLNFNFFRTSALPLIQAGRFQESWHAANQFLWRGGVAPEEAGCTWPCVPIGIGIGMLCGTVGSPYLLRNSWQQCGQHQRHQITQAASNINSGASAVRSCLAYHSWQCMIHITQTHQPSFATSVRIELQLNSWQLFQRSKQAKLKAHTYKVCWGNDLWQCGSLLVLDKLIQLELTLGCDRLCTRRCPAASLLAIAASHK